MMVPNYENLSSKIGLIDYFFLKSKTSIEKIHKSDKFPTLNKSVTIMVHPLYTSYYFSEMSTNNTNSNPLQHNMDINNNQRINNIIILCATVLS